MCILSLQVEKPCSSPVISSSENSFRVKCPSSLPLVSLVLQFHVMFFYRMYLFSTGIKDLQKCLVLMLYNTLSVCDTHCVLYVCMCTAGLFCRLFCRLLRPRWGCATKASRDDGEQQLRVSNSRLRKNKWCVLHPPPSMSTSALYKLLYTYFNLVDTLLYVLRVLCSTVAQTAFSLQIAEGKPREI